MTSSCSASTKTHTGNTSISSGLSTFPASKKTVTRNSQMKLLLKDKVYIKKLLSAYLAIFGKQKSGMEKMN